MGLKAVQLLQQTGKAVSKYTDDVVGLGVRKWTKPTSLEGLRFAPEAIGDTVRFSVGNNFKNITQELLTTIKPSKFRSILASRKDISNKILQEIDTPDKLALYDKTVDLLKERNLSDAEFNRFYRFIFMMDKLDSARLQNVTAKFEIIPELLKKGYPVMPIAKMPVTDFNKKQILNVLAKKEEILKIIGEDLKDEFTKIMQLSDIIRYVDDNNVKYLEECLQHTKNAQNLVFWKSDSLKILKDLCEDIEGSSVTYVLESIFRRNLSYDDVLKVAQNGKLSSKDIKLLEFINFDKLKNIGLDDLDKLSVEERKNLLDGYISALDTVPLIGTDSIPHDIKYLSSRMKIFENLDRAQTLTEYRDKYYETLRKIISSIPDAERKAPINSTSLYRGVEQYLINNPIPALVDDLENLPFKEIMVKGKKIKIIEIAKDTNLNLAIHHTADPRSILNLEAMEMTTDALLCTGLKDNKTYDKIFFGTGSFGVALKPQENTEIFLQSYGDIMSNCFKKTPYNMVRGSQRYLNDSASSYIPELIKKELDLSQVEYTKRVQKIAKATTLDEINKIDPEFAAVIRKITGEYPMFEGLIKPEIMGVCVDANIPIEELAEDVLEFCAKNDKRRLIRITGY